MNKQFEDLRQLKKLSTESLIIWLIGKSQELNQVLSIEEIVLRAWKINPDKHSMRGHPEYPDSFVIMKRVYDMKGRKGYLEGSSSSGFKLTPLSRNKYRDLKHLISNKKINKSKSKNAADRTISSIDEAPYKKLVNSPAYQKFIKGNLEQIVETDFLYFYGIAWHTKTTIASGKIKNVDIVVNQFKTKDPELLMVYDLLNEKFSGLKDKFLTNKA